MEIAGGETTHKKGDNYEGDTFSGRALVECFALRVRRHPGRRGRRPRKTAAAGGQLSSPPRLFSASRTNRPQLHVRLGATRGCLELSGQSPIPYRELCAS